MYEAEIACAVPRRGKKTRRHHDRLMASDSADPKNSDTRKRVGMLKRQQGRSLQIASTSDYMLMMSYISPLATACCTVATPSLRLAFSV
jgi:hypothetical protein